MWCRTLSKLKQNGMSFVLRIESENFSIYFEMRGATCSFAKSWLENNRVRRGTFLDDLGWRRALPCRLFFFKQVMAFWRKQMEPLDDPDGSCLGSGDSRWELVTAGAGTGSVGSALGCLVGWHVSLPPIDITSTDLSCSFWLEGVLRTSAFRGGSCGVKLLSLPLLLCWADSIKVKPEVRQPLGSFSWRGGGSSF